MLFENFDLLRDNDEIKFVIGSRVDYDWAKNIISKYHKKGTVTFSPVYGKIDYSGIVKWILEDKLDARFQVQLHKVIWGPDKQGINGMYSWEELIKVCSNCTKCGLSKTRTNIVIGRGNINAPMMLVGRSRRTGGFAGTSVCGAGWKASGFVAESNENKRGHVLYSKYRKMQASGQQSSYG